MPYFSSWCPREVFVEHNGVTIYHDYDDGNADDRLIYHFSTSEEEEQDCDPKCLFDVRDLSTWPCDAGLDEDARIDLAIRLAIDQGILKQDQPVEP